MAGGRHEAIGILTDGKLVRIAYVIRKGGHFYLQDMVEALLPRPLGEAVAEVEAEDTQSTESVLGLTRPQEAAEVELEESGDPQTVLFNLLSKFPLKNTRLAMNLAPSRARLSEFPDDFGLKGAKLSRRVLDHLREAGRPELPPDRVGIVKLPDGRILSVDHDDPLPLLDSIKELQSFVGGRVHFSLVDSPEMALLALASISLPDDDKVTALAHVGANTTHTLFLRGRSFLRAATPLHLGSHSKDLAATLARRMSWAQEEAGLPEPERIVLCGIEDTEYDGGVKAALAVEFQQAEILYLRPPGVDAGGIEERDLGKVPSYAVPIALAMKALDPKMAGQFPTNFIPASVLEAQRTLKIAWHGVLVLALIFAAVVGLILQSTQMMIRKQQATQQLRVLEQDLAERKKIRAEGDKVEAELTTYTVRLGVVDSLSLDFDHWSRFLRGLSQTAGLLGGTWYTNLAPADSLNVSLKGRALYRDRVPRLAMLFDSSEVREVIRTDIREVPVYEYTVVGIPKGTPIPPPAPPPAPKKKGGAKAAGGAAK